MLMAVNEPYALMVQPDDILISPREVDEHFGTMVCFHPRYALGDHHNYMDKDDFLREMYLGQHRTIAEASAVESPIRQETIGFPAHFFARAHNFKPPGRACQPEADSPMRT